MKYVKLIVFLIIVSLTSCDKENDSYRSTGIITGADLTMCACCGGWIIFIDDVRYLFDTLPKSSNLNIDKETFPLKVRLDWELTNSGCPLNRINVIRIRKD